MRKSSNCRPPRSCGWSHRGSLPRPHHSPTGSSDFGIWDERAGMDGDYARTLWPRLAQSCGAVPPTVLFAPRFTSRSGEEDIRTRSCTDPSFIPPAASYDRAGADTSKSCRCSRPQTPIPWPPSPRSDQARARCSTIVHRLPHNYRSASTASQYTSPSNQECQAKF